MFPITTELHQQQEENKPNRLFNSILKLKAEQKEKKKLLKDFLSADNQMQGIEEQLNILKIEEKKRKNELLQQSKANDLKQDIEGLKLEIKNDSDILKDFAVVAVAKGEQLNLFDENTMEEYFPDLKIDLKKK